METAAIIPRRCHRPHVSHGTRTQHFFLPQILGASLWRRAGIADVACRDGTTRLGRVRRHSHHRRCLRGPSEFRHGARRTLARGPGFPRRHYQPTRLALGRGVSGARPAETFFRHHRRQHGFDGQPLYRRPKNPLGRRLYPRRRRRQASRPRGDRVCTTRARSLSGRANRDRRHRGLTPAYRALRLLVRNRAPLNAAGCQGRSAGVRQRRTPDCRDRPSAGRRQADPDAHRHPRHRLRAKRHSGRLESDRFHVRGYARHDPATRRSLRPRSGGVRTGNRQCRPIHTARAETGPESHGDPSAGLRPRQKRPGALRPRLARAASRNQPRQRARAGATPRRPRRVDQPAADPADHAGDGPALRTAVHPPPASGLYPDTGHRR